MKWNLAEAKNKLTEVVNRALTEGPQFITRRDDKVVVLSAEKYEELTKPRRSFKEFLLQGEAAFDDLDLTRDQSTMRDVDL